MANALSNLSQSVTNAMQVMYESERQIKMSKTSNNFSEDYRAFTANLAQEQNYNLLDESLFTDGERDQIATAYDIDLNALDADGGLTVPAWQVNSFLHDRWVKERTEADMDSMGRRDQEAYRAMVAQHTHDIGNALLQQGIEQRQATIQADFTKALYDAKKAGDFDTADAILSEGVKLGVFDVAAAEQERMTLEGDITYSIALDLVENGTQDDLDLAGEMALDKEGPMTLEQRADINNKLLQQDEINIKSEMAHRAVESNKTLTDYLAQLYLNPMSMTDREVVMAREYLTDDDFVTLLQQRQTIMNARANQSDPFYENYIQSKVAALAVPNGTEFIFRKQQLVREVMHLAGLDNYGNPDPFIPAKINGQLAREMMTQINSLQDAPINDPNVEAQLDYGVALLTGGSRSNFGQFGTSENIQLASMFQRDLINAALDTPNFDAEMWMENNFYKYSNKRLESASRRVVITQMGNEGRLIKDESADGIKKVNVERSREKVKEALKNGTITDRTAERELDYLNDEEKKQQVLYRTSQPQSGRR